VAQDKIILEGMCFYGHHGCHPQEREWGQPFVVDVELFLDLERAAQEDNPDFSVNYEEVFRLVKRIVSAKRYNLLEALAGEIASQLLASFPIEGITVRVKKPRAPLPGQFNWVAVEIHRKIKGL